MGKRLETIGMPNTPENLAKWLHDPQSVKPGAYMGEVIKNGTIPDEDIDALVKYLESLTPAGGCPEIPVQPGVTEQVTPANP